MLINDYQRQMFFEITFKKYMLSFKKKICPVSFENLGYFQEFKQFQIQTKSKKNIIWKNSKT